MRDTPEHHGFETRMDTLLVGGCHGSCCILSSDDEEGAAARRQFMLANGLVLTFCLTILALVAAIASI
jgi:hypothetical protein